MPPLDTQRVALRLKEMAVMLATSLPDMHWKTIHTELENRKRNGEFLGKPKTTQKIVATARKLGPSPEDHPWQIDMVGEGTHVPPAALADVLAAWRWHVVGCGTTFTVRMAKWVARLRLLAGTDRLKIDLNEKLKQADNPAGEKAEIWDGLSARQSLELARVSMRFAVEEIACVALKRRFNPTGRMIELAWEWLDQSRDVMKQTLRTKAMGQVKEMIDRAEEYEMLGYESAIWAETWVEEWRNDNVALSGEEGTWPVLLPLLDPLDYLATDILNRIRFRIGREPRWEVAELVILNARSLFTDVAGWLRLKDSEKDEFVKNALFEIKTGRYETVAQRWALVWPETTNKGKGSTGG